MHSWAGVLLPDSEARGGVAWIGPGESAFRRSAADLVMGSPWTEEG